MSNAGNFKKWWKYNYHFLAWLCLLTGVTVLLFGIMGAWYDGKDAPAGLGFLSGIGAWGYWGILGGILAVLLGGYYTYDHLAQIKRFEKMMENRGRVNFIKELDEIERLAYGLGASFERRVVGRKKEYKLK